jgi:hypothetical protein
MIAADSARAADDDRNPMTSLPLPVEPGIVALLAAVAQLRPAMDLDRR